LLLSRPSRLPPSWARENPDFASAGRASCIEPRTILKWDYNLEIHDGEGASTQAGSDGNGR
jgi:hypothetical protein